MPDLLNRHQAAAQLGLSYSTLARWASQRVGPSFIKIGGLARYDPTDLTNFVNGCRVYPAADELRKADSGSLTIPRAAHLGSKGK